MSKERARRRAAREAAAAAQEAERERSRARAARRRQRQERLSAWAGRIGLAPGGRPGQQTGTLAARRRLRMNLIVVTLVLVQLAVWFLREDWRSSLAALVVSALAFPVIVAFAL